MRNWILAGATILLMQGMEAREPWGPPPVCPQPKAECCPKPKCAPAPCAQKPCKPKPECKPCPEQPCPPTKLCPSDPCCPEWPQPVLYAGYSYPASIRTRCPYNVYVDASFIFWQPSEDNLELGFTNNNTTGFASPFVANAPVNATSQPMEFDYKPGFKVGLGGKFNYDDWDLHAEYTWFHNTQDRSVSVPVPNTNGQIFATQGIPFSGVFTTSNVATGVAGNVFNSASGSWRLHMDLVDLDLGRWYYSGRKLTFRPSLGMRGAFIGQHYNVTYTNTAAFGVGFADIQKVTRNTHSWAVGPKVELDSNWDLGYGLRLFGNGEFDLLYTRYTTLSFKETHTAVSGSSTTPFVSGTVRVKDQAIGAIRSHFDLEVGFGWGTYFSCNSYYWDLSASYGFQVFFDQNMFRKFSDDISWFTGLEPNGNLYIHGLTVTTRFDF